MHWLVAMCWLRCKVGTHSGLHNAYGHKWETNLKHKMLAAPPVTVGTEQGPALWAFIEEVGV